MASYRPTWFGLRPKPAQVYTTDARAGVNRYNGSEPSTLPVALQVPTDTAVTPTNAETIRTDVPATAPVPDFGGKPSKPGEDEVNPLPPAAEPGTPAAIANRMPEVPAVDPLAAPKVETPEPSAANPAVKAAAVVAPTADDKTVQVNSSSSDASRPAGLPEATMPASYGVAQVDTKTITTGHHHKATSAVMATPQSDPKPPVTPTSQAKPSEQSETCTEKNCCEGQGWKRPCLRRLVRRVCKMGEFASPPTAAPH